ncbi:voltage-dependent calcium channel gamma-5 subunit [Plakobranchus ocellatus]|uniref:Voltage-dependent calcium channel gamma-5 subunit n=1 Tax=Plakobranchus ocellatus TaxID=259542 RepID=A0AAV3YCR0_9GAST|nr:voltage-dependent calcium channel gamma-5 subunit [Plakobranchus ocellatus]
MSTCATTLIVIATILGPVTLVFMAVSFGTDHWLEFRVDRSKLSDPPAPRDWKRARYYTSRDRGIFRECYPDNNTEFLDYAEDVVDSYCFNIEYDQPSDVNDPSDYYMARIHLNRCFLAFFIMALVLFVLGYVFGLILCCMRISRWAYTAGLCSYSSAFALAAAIAFFHGAEYIERNKLNGGAEEAEFYASWDTDLKNATDRDYGWSYALGWVGMILAALTATFYSLAGCYLTGERYEDREVLEKRGIARDYPIAMEPVYAVGTDPYYSKHYGYPRAYLGPMAPEYYARPYPSIGYGDPTKDIYQWREIES